MSRARPRYGAPRANTALLGAAGLALLAGLLVAVGWSGVWHTPEARSAPPPGTVPIPVAPAPLAAHTELQLDHLLEPGSGALAVVHLPADSILAETITDPEHLIGRVLARDKQPGRVFRESDFLPPGTRPGLVAGIPAGKRALRIDARKVNGIVGLRRGDRFDLVSTRRASPASSGGIQPVYGNALASGASVRLVVENGAVVEPLSQRTLPGAAGGASVVQEIVIAVAPAEVGALSEALELASRIDCVPRSGRPEAADEDADSEDASSGSAFRWSGEAVVETIEGDRRSLRAVPQAPPVAAGPTRGGS